MKALLSITAFCCLVLTVQSQAEDKKLNPPTLRQALISFTWTWKPLFKKGEEHEIRFYKDGVAASEDWNGVWTATGLRTVTIEARHREKRQGDKPKTKAVLTFDPTFSTFEAIYWDGVSKVTGGRKAPADPEATVATTPK